MKDLDVTITIAGPVMAGKTVIISQLVELFQRQGMEVLCDDEGKDTDYFKRCGPMDLKAKGTIKLQTELT